MHKIIIIMGILNLVIVKSKTIVYLIPQPCWAILFALDFFERFIVQFLLKRLVA